MSWRLAAGFNPVPASHEESRSSAGVMSPPMVRAAASFPLFRDSCQFTGRPMENATTAGAAAGGAAARATAAVATAALDAVGC
ncbi:MAG: hypothetical protein KF712_02740 [Akkermansiaceae bacterium]|nr:hypothetical protein [Akkermansiaceae bacterium]